MKVVKRRETLRRMSGRRCEISDDTVDKSRRKSGKRESLG